VHVLLESAHLAIRKRRRYHGGGRETELVILVTTYLVQPTRNRLAATPIDRAGQLAVNRRPVVSPAAFSPPPLQSGYFIK
jgi:hypothetical protein